MDDLALWLTAQLDEDERLARAACGPDNLWKVAEQASCECCSNARTAKDVLVCTPDDRDAPHIAEWSPVRVLREIDAKRELVQILAHATQHHEQQSMALASLALIKMATVYVRRPGYAEVVQPLLERPKPPSGVE